VDFSPDPEQQAVADVVTSAPGRDNNSAALVDGGVIALGAPDRLWLDSQTKRNLVITFGGGVNQTTRETIAASDLKVPRVPR
jgi:hypothetical protein